MAHLILLGIVYVSFISLGLPDGILGVAWPAIRADMGQPLAAVGAITIAMTISSATASYFAGAIAKRIGTGAVVAASCLMTALALLGFAVAPSFGWLVALGIPLGLGAGAVDASLNHFVAAHYSSRHMNWLHGFWGVGATTGPLIMGLALASSGGWSLGVRSIGLMQLTLAVVLFATLALWAKEHSKPPANEDAARRGDDEIERRIENGIACVARGRCPSPALLGEPCRRLPFRIDVPDVLDRAQAGRQAIGHRDLDGHEVDATGMLSVLRTGMSASGYISTSGT